MNGQALMQQCIHLRRAHDWQVLWPAASPNIVQDWQVSWHPAFTEVRAGSPNCRYVRGQGLGRQKQGIAKPVEARLRGKGIGLGFGERNRPEPEPEAQPSAAAQVWHWAELCTGVLHANSHNCVLRCDC